MYAWPEVVSPSIRSYASMPVCLPEQLWRLEESGSFRRRIASIVGWWLSGCTPHNSSDSLTLVLAWIDRATAT